MTGERIVRSILLIPALALGVVGCPPEPPDENDAGIGGSAPTGGTTGMGGRATGGAVTAGAGGATGSTAVSVCQTVTTLPEQYSSCGSATGESRCLANGDRCVCMRGVWFCNTECANIPEPIAGTDCSSNRGTACNYANGLGCQCAATPSESGTINRWMCMGSSSSCPAAGSIGTGDPCTQYGIICDYPPDAASPARTYHEACDCMAPYDASAGSTWTCLVSGNCPATQPVYPTACTSMRLCTYGNVHCSCMNGGNWICDWPPFWAFWDSSM